MNEEMLTLGEVAKLLKVSHWTVRREVDRGHLKGRQVGKLWRFRREDVDAYMRGEGNQKDQKDQKEASDG